MSGSARRRGKPGNAGRGAANDPSDTSSLPSGPGQSIGAPAAPRGGFDGPASRGSASGPAGSQSRRGSNVPSVGSAPQSQPTSPRPGQGPSQSNIAGVVGSQPPSRAGVQPAPTAPMQGDPARDGPAPKYTDQMRNIDLPPSFYNYDKEVSAPHVFTPRLSLHHVHCCTMSCMPRFSKLQYHAAPAAILHKRGGLHVQDSSCPYKRRFVSTVFFLNFAIKLSPWNQPIFVTLPNQELTISSINFRLNSRNDQDLIPLAKLSKLLSTPTRLLNSPM